MRFSQRQGYTAVRDIVQREAADLELRSGLWNVLGMFVLHKNDEFETDQSEQAGRLAFRIWHNYFKQPVDTIPRWWSDVRKQLREYFFECPWYEVYDFVEFVVGASKDMTSDHLPEAINTVLERDMSAWRMVGGRFVEVTSSEEISEIQEALDSGLPSVRAHLQSALTHLSDRQTPDYRNSIKESISAVEAMTNSVAGTSRATLGAALKVVGADAHPALVAAFDKLYGYTSDAQGIRHALMDEPNLESEDAKFMLVACSAFVNYLVAKRSRSGAKV